MVKDINQLIKLSLLSFITYFVCSVLYSIFFWIYFKLGTNPNYFFPFVKSLFFNGLYSFFVGTLIFLLFYKYKIYFITTKNIVVSITLTIIIFLIVSLMNYGYSQITNYYFSHLTYSPLKSYKLALILSLTAPVKVLINSLIITLISSFIIFMIIKQKWIDYQSEQLITPNTHKIITCGYSILAALIVTMCYHLTTVIHPNSYINLTSFFLRLVALTFIVFISNFFFIYSWTIKQIAQAYSCHKPPIVKMLILSLTCYLLLATLVVIVFIYSLDSSVFSYGLDWLLYNKSIIILFALISTIAFWWLLIKVAVFIKAWTIFYLLNILLAIFIAVSDRQNILIVISIYFICLNISFFICFCCAYFPARLSFKK